MIIARQKKKENLAEFVLYMWQIEDMIRACDLDMNVITEKLINGYQVDDATRKEITDWYAGLVGQMKDEKIEKLGHLQSITNQVNDLHEFHVMLMNHEDETSYQEFANIALSNIQLFREKSKDKESNDIEICLNALYSLLMLRLQKKEINKETETAMNSFSNLMGLLSQKYIEYHKGELEL